MAENTQDAQAHVDLLAGADLFAGLDRIALAKLAAYLDPLPVSEGEAVVTRGDEGNSLYLISQGSFGVFVAGPDGKRLIQVATLGRGACFGEMALLTGEVRSATVQALGAGEVLRLDQARFMDVLRQEPSIGLAVSATLSRRLRDATQGEARTAEALGHALDRYLAALDEPRRTRVLQASLLDDTSEPVMKAVFGKHAGGVADAAAICIEDKRFPKVNSFVPGGQDLVTVEEFTEKVRAAKAAQKADDFVLIARVEALIAGRGIREALDRAYAYADAGADAILIHSKSSTPQQIIDFMAAWEGMRPVVVVPTTYYTITASQLQDLGVKAVIYANHGIRAAITAMASVYKTILDEGSTASVEDRIASLDVIFQLQGMEEIQRAVKA